MSCTSSPTAVRIVRGLEGALVDLDGRLATFSRRHFERFDLGGMTLLVPSATPRPSAQRRA